MEKNGKKIKISDLLQEYIDSKAIHEDIFVEGVTANSRDVLKNFIFFAIQGEQFNGEDFIPEALNKGSKVIVVDESYTGKFKNSNCMFVYSKNIRKNYAVSVDRFYKNKPKLLVGITGTNGKTSTAWYTNKIWNLLGVKSASIGTLGVNVGPKIDIGNLTTPDPVALSKILKQLYTQGITNTVIEASSHGLSQYRLDGLNFSISAITSLGRDHLDYHKTYNEYLKSKLRLFSDITVKEGIAIINNDIVDKEIFINEAKLNKLKVVTVGSKDDSDWHYIVKNKKNLIENIELTYQGKKSLLNTSLVGNFQISNLIISMAIAKESGFEREDIEQIVSNISAPPGRLEQIYNNKSKKIFIDYAHSPDALESALIALRPHTKNRLVLVFGCGGDRDKGKRSMMGRVAQYNADKIIVTDDNPRTENAKYIRSQIISGCPNSIEISDRKEAILMGIQALKKGDVLLIAGKGHETTQIIGNEKKYFSDKNVVNDIIDSEFI